MESSSQNIQAIQDIRRYMERSSRFISLSGWSGISAGCCALIGAFFARQRISEYYDNYEVGTNCVSCLRNDLITIATAVFVAAFVSAAFFTFLKTKKDGVPIWGATAKRLLWNTLMPMAVGGLVIWRMITLDQYELVPAISLVFYGLALVNGSKYTLGEIKYLGYAEILTGIAALWLIGSGIFVWAFGFGVLHIIYGFSMWWKHERGEQ